MTIYAIESRDFREYVAERLMDAWLSDGEHGAQDELDVILAWHSDPNWPRSTRYLTDLVMEEYRELQRAVGRASLS